MVKDVLGFAENLDKTTYALGYRIAVTGIKNDAVFNKVEITGDARIKNDNLHCMSFSIQIAFLNRAY